MLNSSVLAQVEDIVTDRDGVEGLTWIDLEQDTTHMDCPHIQRTRYPFEKYSSYDMLKSGDARALLRRKTSIDVAVLSVNATLPG